MDSEWLNIEGAVEQAKRLLTRSGVPLEVRVAQLCQDFVTAHTEKTPGLSVSADRIIYYRDVTADTPREIDRLVSLDVWINLGNEQYWTLNLYIPIECKYRENLECFGFPVENFSDSLIHYPIFSETGSTMSQYICNSIPNLIYNEPVSFIRFIEFETKGNSINLKKLYTDDDHIFKTGLSLYDYIKTQIPPVPKYYEDDVLENMDVINHKAYTAAHPKTMSRTWSSSKNDIINTHSIDDFRNYNQRRFDNHKPMFHTDIYFPIMCINSPIHLLKFNDDHSISSFESKDFLLTGIIVPSWPEATPYYIDNPVKESLMLLTNPEGLPLILNSLYNWFLEIVALINSNQEIIEQVPLERAIYQYVLEKSKENQVWAGIL